MGSCVRAMALGVAICTWLLMYWQYMVVARGPDAGFADADHHGTTVVHDTPPPHPESELAMNVTENEYWTARGVFDEIDTDGDGDVSASELVTHSKGSVDDTLHTSLAEHEQHVLHLHDANKDGFLQFREFVDFMYPPALAEDDVLTSL